MSVLLSKINLCVQRDHYAGTHARHIQSFPSTSSPVSSQRLLSYATSQEKSGTVATKLDEGWNCSISLVPKPGCGFPNWSHSSSAARLSVSVSSLNTKHGCTLYNNQDCLLFLKVETDYVTQLGRIWGAKSFLIQDFPIRILMTYVMLLATIKKLFFFLPFFPPFFPFFLQTFSQGETTVFFWFCFLAAVLCYEASDQTGFGKGWIVVLQTPSYSHMLVGFWISLLLLGVLPKGTKANTSCAECVLRANNPQSSSTALQ